MRRLLPLLLLPFLWGADEPAAEPKSLPARTLASLDGRGVALASLPEDGPFLLDFWATWCLPCRHAFPQYAALQEKYADRGFRVVTVSQDAPGSEAKIESLLRLLSISFPVLLDPEAKLADEMGVLNLPTSFLIDGEGTIVWSHTGFVPGDEKQLEAQLEKLFAQSGD